MMAKFEDAAFHGVRCRACGTSCPYCSFENGTFWSSAQCEGGHCEHMREAER